MGWSVSCRLFLLGGIAEAQADVAVEVVKAFAGERGIVSGLGQHERALDHRLRVAREALGHPVARDATISTSGRRRSTLVQGRANIRATPTRRADRPKRAAQSKG